MSKPKVIATRSLRGFGLYLFATRLLCPLVPFILKRRLKKGKEHPVRWREKLGYSSHPRPDGPLIWLHAVGLGEALALRALIAALETRHPTLNILITSVTRGSAEALEKNGIGRAIHQFLPLDCPTARRRFLNHWQPDYAVWSEQDIWPGLVHATAQRNIPQAWVNARMNDAAQQRRSRSLRLYRAVYGCFGFISAQDDRTAHNIASFGAIARVDGSLKPAAQPLADNERERTALAQAIGRRRIWLAASSHPEDEKIALDALQKMPRPGLLIIAPRYAQRGAEIEDVCKSRGLNVARRAAGTMPDTETQVYIADTVGEMGLWYRMADAALIGGTFGAVEGHNPWEAAALNCAILHGKHTANFLSDYMTLDSNAAARPIHTADDLAAALQDHTLPEQINHASQLVLRGRDLVDELANLLLTEMDAHRARTV